jgi:hypothetical protein
MSLPISLPELPFLLSTLSYDPASGYLIRTKGKRAGQRAGCHQPRTRLISIQGHHYAEHRVIWKMQTGADPTMLIDHINGDPHDNRWCNLREATNRQNSWNSHGKPNVVGKGYKGVRACNSRWRSCIRTPEGRKHLGTFDTAEEASNAYKKAASELHQSYFKPPKDPQ